MRWIRQLQLWQSLTIGSDRLTYIGPDHPRHDAALFACLPAIFGEERFMAIPFRRAVQFGTAASLRMRWGSSPARVCCATIKKARSATIYLASDGGTSAQGLGCCQARSRHRRWPEGPGLTAS